jgi:hypothetical protein
MHFDQLRRRDFHRAARRRGGRAVRKPIYSKASPVSRDLPLWICTDHPSECHLLHVFIEDRVRTLGHSLAAISIATEQRRKVDATLINKPPHFIRMRS